MAIWVTDGICVAGYDSWEQLMKSIAQGCGWRVNYAMWPVGTFTFVKRGRQSEVVREDALIDAALEHRLPKFLAGLRRRLTSG